MSRLDAVRTWRLSTFTRSPWAMLASTRCRPHSGVGEALGTGVPGAEATRSTWAPPSREQAPVNAPSLCTNVVEAAGHVRPSTEMPAAISVPGANGAAGTTEASGTERSLPSAAGLVQAVSSAAPSGSPRKSATRLSPRPKIASSGGVSLNVLNASTHERWVGPLAHAGCGGTRHRGPSPCGR